ncbi:MAG: CRTAC1 family protein, partial [Bacteroidales bacterium]|nr:CRTAC1 family protein [Bacteroidales bacterium]
MKKITKIFVLFFFSLILLINLSFSQTFTKIDTGVIATDLGPSCGSSWGDYDNDGLLDLFICNWTVDAGGTQNFLYHNEGNGYFTKIKSGAVVDEIGFFSGSAWGDYDNDGFLDLVVPNRDGNVMLFHNNANGDFEKIDNTLLANLNEHFRGSSWIDLNKDGYLDLFFVTYSTDYLFQNLSGGNFIEIKNTVLTRANKRKTSCNSADYDNDGDLDVFIPVYPGTNLFYINNGDGSFSLDNETNIINDEYSISGRWGDCNNDGFLDLYVRNMDDQSPPNSLYLNNGNGTFEKIISGNVVTDQGASLGCSWGDFDNDGDLDLFVSNMDYQGYKNNLYLNNGTGAFTKATEGVIINENGAGITVCDFDNDGDLDILITDGGPMGVPATNYLYSNDGNDNNWINIKPIGTTSNTTGSGARLKLKATILGSEVWQIREQNESSMRAHFGLGDALQVDSLIVQWS